MLNEGVAEGWKLHTFAETVAVEGGINMVFIWETPVAVDA